jgi:hypothetical protein
LLWKYVGQAIESAVVAVWQEDASPDSALDALDGRLLIERLDDERRGRNPVVARVHCRDLEEDVQVRAWCRPRIDGFDHVPSVVPIFDVPKAHT